MTQIHHNGDGDYAPPPMTEEQKHGLQIVYQILADKRVQESLAGVLGGMADTGVDVDEIGHHITFAFGCGVALGIGLAKSNGNLVFDTKLDLEEILSGG